MKLITTLLATAFLVSCGTESNQSDENVTLQEIQGEEAKAIEASVSETPAKIVSRIPVVDGELQFDQAEVVEVDANVATSSPEAIANAFEGSENKSNVAELDADTSSNSFSYRYSRGYRYGYGYSRGGCGWGGCGARRSVYYGTRYSYGATYRAAYRPYNYGYGCQRGGYYYASYSRGSSWYSYGRPSCGGYACGGSYSAGGYAAGGYVSGGYAGY